MKVWATILGWTWARFLERISSAIRRIAFAHTPVSRQRRHCCHTADEGG
jgi:hypothetical protein